MAKIIKLLIIEDNEDIIDLIKLYKPESMEIFDNFRFDAANIRWLPSIKEN